MWDYAVLLLHPGPSGLRSIIKVLLCRLIASKSNLHTSSSCCCSCRCLCGFFARMTFAGVTLWNQSSWANKNKFDKIILLGRPDVCSSLDFAVSGTAAVWITMKMQAIKAQTSKALILKLLIIRSVGNWMIW